MPLLPRFPKAFGSWARQESFNEHIDTDLKTIESLVTNSVAYDHELILNETANGTNDTFTYTKDIKVGTDKIFIRRGKLQRGTGKDYTINPTTKTIKLLITELPQSGDMFELWGNYAD